VVDFDGPIPVNVTPRQPMTGICHAINPYLHVSKRVDVIGA